MKKSMMWTLAVATGCAGAGRDAEPWAHADDKALAGSHADTPGARESGGAHPAGTKSDAEPRHGSELAMVRVRASGAGDDGSESGAIVLEELGEITTDPLPVALEDLEAAAVHAGAMSYEQLRAQSATAPSGYLVDGDMHLSSDDQLRQYYYEQYLPRHIESGDKLIVALLGSGARDLRPSPMDIRYCFGTGFGSPNITRAAAQAGVESAMRAWQAVAKLRFRHVPGLDGTSCSNSGSNPGVDFVIAPSSSGSSCGAIGPLPSNAWANQLLQVPLYPSTVTCSDTWPSLAIHEVGHVLGFRHEHVHTDASPRCNEDIDGDGADSNGDEFEELTGYDDDSIMGYANCSSSAAVLETELSHLDGIGAREAYGPPDWWWGVLL